MSGRRSSRPIRRGLRWFGLALVTVSLAAFLLRGTWEQRRIDRLAGEIVGHYDIALRFGDPAEFHLPPYPPAGELIRAEPAEPHDVYSALRGIERALSVYPPDLIDRHLAAIFIGHVAVGSDFETLEVIAQDDVYDACHGVSTVDGGRAFGNDFYSLCHGQRNQADVELRRCTAHAR